jgi:hypothetical protein
MADNAAEIAHARDRALDVARLRAVPANLDLELRPSDWLDMVGRSPSPRVRVRVTSIHEPILYRRDVGWVRVWGHTPHCGSHPDHGPCITLMARLGALLDAVPS